jgi:RNA polymerase sigma-B factor
VSRAPASWAAARRDLERYHDTGDRGLRDALTRRFLPLARQVAWRYHGGGEDLDDLNQVAAIGLIHAIDRFDPARGTAFSTFAIPTIAGELKRHYRDTGWAVRVPRGLQEAALRVERVADELERELGRPPTVAQIAERMGTTAEHVLEAREAALAHRAVALDPLTAGDDEAVLVETIGVVEQGFGRVEEALTVERLLSTVGDLESRILILRFEQDLTQREIGERVGISQMQVSRILRHVLGELRESADLSGGAGPDAGRAATRA